LTVTADPASRGYGYANPAFTATLSGFKNGETAAAVSGAAGFTGAATTTTATSTVGPYTITPTVGSLTATNYDFPLANFVNGTLTIGKRNATWTTNNNNKFWGQGDPNPLTTGSGSSFLVVDGVTAT